MFVEFFASGPTSPPGSAGRSRSLRRPVHVRQQPLFMEASPHLPTPEQELAGEHGEVFTRRWVVDLILDLVGYDERLDLARLTAVEPSCGQAPS